MEMQFKTLRKKEAHNYREVILVRKQKIGFKSMVKVMK